MYTKIQQMSLFQAICKKPGGEAFQPDHKNKSIHLASVRKDPWDNE